MVAAACERPCIEMGSRRTHEEAAVAAARAAYLVGFWTTSNLEAGRRYGVPTSGTSAHAFTLLHDSETAAFAAEDGIGKAVYRRDRSLDPQLVWKGKDEQDAQPLEVPAVSAERVSALVPTALAGSSAAPGSRRRRRCHLTKAACAQAFR